MFDSPKETSVPDTILSEKNFLLFFTNLKARLEQASAHIPGPPGIPLVHKNGLLWVKDKIFVPEEVRAAILAACHDHPLAGHFGVHRTLDLLQRSFWWPDMEESCRSYVLSCTTCSRCKTARSKAWGLLRPLPIPDRPWQTIAMDFIVELPPSAGCSAIFVVVDRLSKMAHFLPLKGTPSARETAEIFIREIIRLNGIPRNIISDRGVQFTSRFWKALCKLLKIELSMSSAYHPQTNGQTERTNQTLEQYLRCFTTFVQDDWVALLPFAEFSYNNSKHSVTGQSPFFANYGFHPSFSQGIPCESGVPAVQDTVNFFSRNNNLLRETLAKAQTASKRIFDKRKKGELILQPDDRVWLSTANLRLACPSKKLAPRFIGPFPVKRKLNDVSYELSLPDTLRIHPIFHVSLLKPVIPDNFPGRSSDTPEPVFVDGDVEYEVEAVVDCRKRGNQLQFLIKWKGYGPEENSWEPERNVHAADLIQAFFRAHPQKRSLLGTRRLPLRGGNVRNLSGRLWQWMS